MDEFDFSRLDRAAPVAKAPTVQDIDKLFQAGLERHNQGDLAAAAALYVDVLNHDPRHGRALQMTGLIAFQSGEFEWAVQRLSEAVDVDPKNAGALRHRALALTALQRFEAAVEDSDRAIRLQPNFLEAHQSRAGALLALGRLEEAVESYDRALALRPDQPNLLVDRGVALKGLGRREEALASFDAALALQPASLASWYNRAGVLKELGRIEDAVESYGRAIDIKPDFAIGHHNRALCRLQLGDYPEGLEEYEWRRRCPTFDDPRYRLERPWQGEPLAGRSLYIFPELFQGDVIQFARYALAAEQAGAKVALAAPRAMHALLQTLSPSIALMDQDEVPAELDLQSALLSLPKGFGTTVETIPVQPYLHADPARIARWRQAIGTEGFKIGVVWQGSTAPYALPLQRSFPLAALQGIAAVPGVRLISLQKVEGLDQLEGLPEGMAVETLGDGFDPGPDAFVDTAAAMMACDLVITPDTSVAHLAGALGANTWVALPFVADWRWLLGRSDSPWYPATRLFRQTVPGDWTGVFADIEATLRKTLAG